MVYYVQKMTKSTYRRLLCINIRYTRNDCMSKSCCHFWDVYSDVGSIWLSVKRNIWLRTEINKAPCRKTFYQIHFILETIFFVIFLSRSKWCWRLFLITIMDPLNNLEWLLDELWYVTCITFTMFGNSICNWKQSPYHHNAWISTPK